MAYRLFERSEKNMPISFEIPEHIQQQTEMVKMAAEYVMRLVSRELDEREHERPAQFIEQMWPFMRDMQKRTLERPQSGERQTARLQPPTHDQPRLMLMIEMLSWGDAGYICACPVGRSAGRRLKPSARRSRKSNS
ncbi:MAG: hypothetical protein LC121_22305 [Anaerolineae bacterium]|nr:hypothetical protein [Anaerolineae bacterium]